MTITDYASTAATIAALAMFGTSSGWQAVLICWAAITGGAI